MMYSVLMQTAGRVIGPVLLLLSLVILYRGHNLPGGGFIGGLMAASAIILQALAVGWKITERKLWVEPITLITLGLLLAMLSGCFGPLQGLPFMTGLWLPAFELPLLGKVKLGTPLLFDVGVYLAVIGFTLKCALSLGDQQHEWNSSSQS